MGPCKLTLAKTFLLESGLSNREMARRTGLAPNTFRKARREDWDPRFSTVQAIVRAMPSDWQPSRERHADESKQQSTATADSVRTKVRNVKARQQASKLRHAPR